jgi:hypothetical protein
MFEITAQPAWLTELDPDAASRLSRNNERLVKGQDEDYQSPAMNHVTHGQIREFVENTFDSGEYSEYMLDIEKANLAKLGPRSIAKPWSERRADLESYFTNESVMSEAEFEEEVSRHIVDSQIPENLRHRLRPVTASAAVEHLEPSTAGGLPFMQKKGILRKEGKATEAYVGKFPCVIYTRTQEGGKTRNVMGVGISDVIREMRYHQAFLPIEKTYSWRTAIVSPSMVDQAISALLRAKTDDDTIVCADFSQYDASVTPIKSGSAFAFIAAHFQRQYISELYDVYVRFATIPFYTPDGEYSGNHGVPSGSAFTNTIDSIAQHTAALRSGAAFSHEQIQGDDGIYLVRTSDVDTLISGFIDSGFTVNESKSDFFTTQEGTYLQRYYHDRYRDTANNHVGVYSIARALLRLKHLERFVEGIGIEEELSGSEYFTLRAISIMENCKHHPHFEDLVNFVRSHDKSDLAVVAKSIRKFEEHPSRRSRTNAVTNQYGDQSGIESFETYKLLTA